MLWSWSNSTLVDCGTLNLPCADVRPFMLEPLGKGRVRRGGGGGGHRVCVMKELGKQLAFEVHHVCRSTGAVSMQTPVVMQTTVPAACRTCMR